MSSDNTTATTPAEDASRSNDVSKTNSSSSVTNATVKDHPEGDEIRRQVEYYFSDENLPTDQHLLQCCGGRENLPVSIHRICGFKKMRHFKPKNLVIAALRRSTLLEVSEDGKTIKRKIPLQGKCLLDPDFFEDDDIAYDPRVQKPAQYPLPLVPQTKADQKTQKPTGFERTYVEPVLTPGEAAQEDEMYDPDKPFVERIEIAIQRFKQRRRMQPMYANVFEKLMRFGGVESGPRMYQGLSKQEIKDMDAEELARALATHHVPWDRSDKRQWVVDFEGICKAFLSSWYPAHYGYASNTVKNACQVIRSFLRYLQYHSICPEYDGQLTAALRICDTAEEQLLKVDSVGLALTGDFNKSASVIFGGAQAGLYIGNKAWAEELKEEGVELEDAGFSEEEARVRFGIAVAVMGSEEQFNLYKSSKMEVVGKKSTLLEVVAIRFPDDGVKATFAAQSTLYRHKINIKSPGKLICKPWYINSCEEYDLPKDMYPTGKPCASGGGQEYEFWIEDDILRDCFIGMKMDVDILILSGGLAILDNVKETMCSFYTWLPNELWMGRKPKEVRWLKRGLGLDDEDNEKTADTADKRASDDGFDDE